MADVLISVDDVYAASKAQQFMIPVEIIAGACVAEVIHTSGIRNYFPSLVVETMQVGIFGKICAMNQLLKEGDRVEIYRPLRCDPRQARRDRALLAQKK